MEQKKENGLQRAWNWVKTHKLESALIALSAIGTGVAVYEHRRIDKIIDDANYNFNLTDDKLKLLDTNCHKINDFVNNHLINDARATNSIAKKLGWSDEEFEYITVHKQDGSYVTPYNGGDVYEF